MVKKKSKTAQLKNRRKRRQEGAKVLVKKKNLSPKYLRHIRSKEWKAFSRLIKEAVGNRCERCSRKPSKLNWLECHHRTYERLGREEPGDVEVLCKQCHDEEHGNS